MFFSVCHSMMLLFHYSVASCHFIWRQNIRRMMYFVYSILCHVEKIPFLNQCHRNNIEKSSFHYLFEWCVCVCLCVGERKCGFSLRFCNVYFSVVIIVSINLYWQALVNFLLALSSVLRDKRKRVWQNNDESNGATRRNSLTHWNWRKKRRREKNKYRYIEMSPIIWLNDDCIGFYFEHSNLV